MTVTYMTKAEFRAAFHVTTNQRQRRCGTYSSPLRSRRDLGTQRPQLDAAPSPIGDPGHSGRANRAPTSSATGAGLRSRSDRQWRRYAAPERGATSERQRLDHERRDGYISGGWGPNFAKLL